MTVLDSYSLFYITTRIMSNYFDSNWANKRKIWEYSENLVLQKYIEEWYNLVQKNFCFRWWEIDIIVRNQMEIVFIEVKTVNWVNDLHNYITPKKINTLRKSADTFIWKNKTWLRPRFDFVFVKSNSIFKIYQNVQM